MVSAIPHRFIVVEGPIGVGKTSLARRLGQSLGGQLVLEQADQNPFLERFYKNPRAAAFQTQLFFLFQRARQLEDVRQEDLFGAVRVADYLLEKDRLFARVTLDDAEYALYERVYERIVVDAPKPDLVVYLQAPVDVLVDRIAKRGIRYEQHIERGYLEKLTQAYARFFHSYDASPLLIVNSAAIDPVNNDGDYQQLFAEISKTRRGRHFFNPAGSSLLPASYAPGGGCCASAQCTCSRTRGRGCRARLLQRLEQRRRGRGVAERDRDVAQPSFVADAADGAAAGALQKFRLAPRKQLDELRVVQAVPHRKVLLGGGTRKLVPRADQLAVVAAVDAIADRAAKLQRNRTGEFDGEVGNAAPCIQPVRRDDGAGGAGGHAGAAQVPQCALLGSSAGSSRSR